MTIKEAILKSLEDIQTLTDYKVVTEHVKANKYYDFKDAKTPWATVSALLGDYIRVGDTRVKRVKKAGAYFYYLTKNESSIDLELLSGDNKIIDQSEVKIIPERKISKIKTYDERSLHKYYLLF